MFRFTLTYPEFPQRQLRFAHLIATYGRHQPTLFMETMTRRVVHDQTNEGYSPASIEESSSISAEPYLINLTGSHLSEEYPMYAQTAEGYTPAWFDLAHTPKGIWAEFVDILKKFIKRSSSVTNARSSICPGEKSNARNRDFVLDQKESGWEKRCGLPRKKKALSEKVGEDLIRSALEENGRRTWRVRFYEGNPVWVYDRRVSDASQRVGFYDDHRLVPSFGDTQSSRIDGVWSKMGSSPMGRHESIAELSPRSVVSAEWTIAARDAHTRSAVSEVYPVC